jgi:hypothetical protein
MNDVLSDMVQYSIENNIPNIAGMLVSVAALVSRELEALHKPEVPVEFAQIPEAWEHIEGGEQQPSSA